MGVGVRMGREEWPLEYGWSAPDVAVCWLTLDELKDGVAAHMQAESDGDKFVAPPTEPKKVS